MKRIVCALALPILALFHVTASAQVCRDYAVLVQVQVDTKTPALNLVWPADPRATQVRVYRREPGTLSWGPAKTLADTDTNYRDVDIVVGTPYEYRIVKNLMEGTTAITAYGYTYSGIQVPMTEHRGTLMLIVDETQGAPLTVELRRLEQDLRADGWLVVRRDVSPNGTAKSVKNQILAEVEQNPDVRAVFLFGHVPVPYSGFLNPDAHPDHYGAWPADAYYGQLTEEEWTDEESDANSKPSRAANKNEPGDGKFDQSQLSTDVELMVGRVDLSRMPEMALSETELLRKYLNKDHDYRTGTLSAPLRALIDDNFGVFVAQGEAFASSGWRNFAPIVGFRYIEELDWFTTLKTDSYLWAYGCGGGSYVGAGGVGSTVEFAATDTRSIFNMLFGSYFGDWDVENSFLRAPLTSSHGLTNVWSGRPYWHFYHMALGEPIGYSTMVSQNNYSANYVANYAARGVHIALMGDPTLRMAYAKPPSDLRLAAGAGGVVNIQWTVPPVGGLGYNVYRAPNRRSPYERINTSPVADGFYTDPAPLADTNLYMVRSINLEVSKSGSYLNLSPGIEDSIAGIIPAGVQGSLNADTFEASYENGRVKIRLVAATARPIDVRLFDVRGIEIATIASERLASGVLNFSLERRLTPGVYFVRSTGGRSETRKLVVLE